MKIALVGVNSDYLQIFAGSDLKFSGHDDNGEPRICEIPNNNFFVGTALQPERSVFNHTTRPLITALLMAALQFNYYAS